MAVFIYNIRNLQHALIDDEMRLLIDVVMVAGKTKKNHSKK